MSCEGFDLDALVINMPMLMLSQVLAASKFGAIRTHCVLQQHTRAHHSWQGGRSPRQPCRLFHTFISLT